MVTINIRKQGGAAIMTIPSDVLKLLDLGIGSTLSLEITPDAFIARPIGKLAKKRYSLSELLSGVSPELLSKLKAETEWAGEGNPVGRELA